MGYTTDFSGCFNINKSLDEKTRNILKGLNNTRRMKRNVKKLAERLNISVKKCIEEYGEEGEFYFDNDNLGQNETSDIVNYNEPPSRQPSLWCGWKYNNNENTIEWDGSEKFYEYIEWINYIKNILENKILPDKIDVDAGTLVLFYGRNYLHRVTPVKSKKPRILVTLNYNEEEGTMLAENARMTFFGRIN